LTTAIRTRIEIIPFQASIALKSARHDKYTSKFSKLPHHLSSRPTTIKYHHLPSSASLINLLPFYTMNQYHLFFNSSIK
jgi:hypothetical protein